ncbi:hypothetical protein LTS10_003286 [Elasticomyces elasticus]|nr:hypothetical protein LTS10_003286 [Elasticomyces elasticus]
MGNDLSRLASEHDKAQGAPSTPAPKHLSQVKLEDESELGLNARSSCLSRAEHPGVEEYQAWVQFNRRPAGGRGAIHSEYRTLNQPLGVRQLLRNRQASPCAVAVHEGQQACKTTNVYTCMIYCNLCNTDLCRNCFNEANDGAYKQFRYGHAKKARREERGRW